jgi:hypothetical protein
MNDLKLHRVASAYRLDDRIIIHANTQTVAGFYVNRDPFIMLDARASVGEIGHAILRAFDAAQFDAPIPIAADLKPLTQRRLKAAGVKSERQLQMRAVHCLVTRTANEIAIMPTHNGGTRGDERGFHFRVEQVIVIALNSSPAQIGAAVLDGFARCTSVFAEV